MEGHRSRKIQKHDSRGITLSVLLFSSNIQVAPRSKRLLSVTRHGFTRITLGDVQKATFRLISYQADSLLELTIIHSVGYSWNVLKTRDD
jgi:hypothetical protein